jgi:hypothetical protein
VCIYIVCVECRCCVLQCWVLVLVCTAVAFFGLVHVHTNCILYHITAGYMYAHVSNVYVVAYSCILMH